MIDKLIAEATDCDFKIELETKKPKSWLKSISAFANGIGGTLFFGVDNNGIPVGLVDMQKDAELISRLIKERIDPIPQFVLEPYSINSSIKILVLTVQTGMNSPYYYSADGVRLAYIRLGNESVPAPAHILNEMILKGSNQTYDSLVTDFTKADYSFTLLEATYLQRTAVHLEPSDYVSFGLMNKAGKLTNAGALLSDQYIIRQSRLFCTRWNGLNKSSIFDDAVDDKEFEGGLLYLLNNGIEFIKNNSKVRWAKTADLRVEKPDYSDRAILEAIVNALIHRNYLILGSEVHIDIYDDRLEIYSPGGMFDGTMLNGSNIGRIESSRRNPVIADLFHRLKYMERRGSGLVKIQEETKKLFGYTETFAPKFISTHSEFTVILMNMNYNQQETGHVTGQGAGHVTGQDDLLEKLLDFCAVPRSRREMQEFAGLSGRDNFNKLYLIPLLSDGSLQMTIPEKPKSKNQKYVKRFKKTAICLK